MRLSGSSVAFAVLMLCLGSCLAAPAQSWQGGAKRPKAAKNVRTPIDEFMRMSPEERQKALDRLPPQKRRRLQDRLERFNQLPQQQQQTLRAMYGRLNQLPPERQQVIRKSLNQFSQQSQERRQAMRRELRGMAPLDAGDREARMSSPEFQGKFSEKERGIIRDMSELLPPQ
jgi:hypothetical protein